MKPKWPNHQAFVDDIVRRCISRGVRERDDIFAHIRLARIAEVNAAGRQGTACGVESLDRSDSSLMVAVSRTTSRKDKNGHRDIWCVPGLPHRYLSVARIKALTARVDDLTITPEEGLELVACVQDLQTLQDYWADKARKCFQAVSQIEQVQIHATVAALDLGEATKNLVAIPEPAV